MAEFPLHDVESAPEAARPILEGAEEAFGFVPNLLRVMAEAPPLLEAYTTLNEILERTSLTPPERQVLLLSVSAENGCEYCVPAHSALAARAGVPEETVEAIREGRPATDARLEALRRFTQAVVRDRGHPSEEEIDRFRDAGYTRANVLEVVLGVGIKTMSNYTNHLAGTPVDEPFEGLVWRTG